MYTIVYAYTYIYVYVYVYVYVHIHTYRLIIVNIYVYMYIHTYTHAHLCIGAGWRPVVQVSPTMSRLDQTTVTNQTISQPVVGGTILGGAPLTAGSKPTKRKNGERDNDVVGKRKSRTCRRCISHGVPACEVQSVAAERPEESENSNVSSAVCLQVASAYKGSLFPALDHFCVLVYIVCHGIVHLTHDTKITLSTVLSLLRTCSQTHIEQANV